MFIIDYIFEEKNSFPFFAPWGKIWGEKLFKLNSIIKLGYNRAGFTKIYTVPMLENGTMLDMSSILGQITGHRMLTSTVSGYFGTYYELLNMNNININKIKLLNESWNIQLSDDVFSFFVACLQVSKFDFKFKI